MRRKATKIGGEGKAITAGNFTKIVENIVNQRTKEIGNWYNKEN